jgi:hypothetical protein
MLEILEFGDFLDKNSQKLLKNSGMAITLTKNKQKVGICTFWCSQVNLTHEISKITLTFKLPKLPPFPKVIRE